MALTAIGENVIVGDRRDSILTLPITDSTTITSGDFVEISGGKLIKSITTLSGDLVGVAASTKVSGVSSTQGFTDYMGVITEGLIKVKGLVEGSGGTYKTALAVGDKVSFHYDATAGYGQFVVNSTSSPVGKVVSGSVASSGSTIDYYDYVLVQLDFEGAGSDDIADGSVTAAKISTGAVTAAKIGTGAVTSTKIAIGGVTSTNIGALAVEAAAIAVGAVTSTKIAVGGIEGTNIAIGAVSSTNTDETLTANLTTSRAWLDSGTFTLAAGTKTIDWSTTISATTGVKIFLQSLTATNTALSSGSMTETNFVVTGAGAQEGVWFAWIPNSSK